MLKAERSKQLLITVNNRVGTLAEITGAVASSGINLIAMCAYAANNEGIIMFVSEDNEKAKKILKQQNYDVREEEIILLTIDNKPGSLQKVTRLVADADIDLNLVYGSVSKSGKTCRLVLIAEDNEQVLLTIKMIEKSQGKRGG